MRMASPFLPFFSGLHGSRAFVISKVKWRDDTVLISYTIKIVIKTVKRHSYSYKDINITKLHLFKYTHWATQLYSRRDLWVNVSIYNAANPQHVRYNPTLREIQRIQLQKSSPVIKLSWEQLLLPVPPSVVILVKSLPQHPPSLQYCRGTYDCIIEASYPSPPTYPP